MTLIEKMLAHAHESPDYEVCGLVVSRGKKPDILRGKNLSANPTKAFMLSHHPWVRAREEGLEILGVYHSHVQYPADPTMEDRMSCDVIKLPFHIVSTLDDSYHYMEPSNEELPYLGRVYAHGIVDCYTLVQDWYRREWGIMLNDYPREDNWWLGGAKLYSEHFLEEGFVELEPNQPLEFGDGILVAVGSTEPNHGAIYLGNDLILHHPRDRLSMRSVYGEFWQQATTHRLRHKNRK